MKTQLRPHVRRPTQQTRTKHQRGFGESSRVRDKRYVKKKTLLEGPKDERATQSGPRHFRVAVLEGPSRRTITSVRNNYLSLICVAGEPGNRQRNHDDLLKELRIEFRMWKYGISPELPTHDLNPNSYTVHLISTLHSSLSYVLSLILPNIKKTVCKSLCPFFTSEIFLIALET